jgi:hypothetical protein
MYGSVQQEAWRQRPEEIWQEVAAIRLEKALRADHGRGSGLARDLRWEIARYAGQLGKRFRKPH